MPRTTLYTVADIKKRLEALDSEKEGVEIDVQRAYKLLRDSNDRLYEINRGIISLLKMQVTAESEE